MLLINMITRCHQLLPFDEIQFERNVCLRETLNTPDDNDIGYFLEVHLSYSYNIRQKLKYFPFCPEGKIISKNGFNDYMSKIKPKTYTEDKKLFCDWTDKKKYLIHYRMLNFYVRHVMVVDEVHEVISFKESKSLEKFLFFIHRNKK